MNLYSELLNGKEELSIIGLGYVGLPMAVEFAKKLKVIGFDINKDKISKYIAGIDPTDEVGNIQLKNTNILFTSDETKLKKAKFHIIAVPTPINSDNTPDLKPIENASRIIGRNLTKDSIIVYESTVYPGVTEEICIPIIEEESGLKCGLDFKIGYSPERINPGDKIHRLDTIKKIVSGIDNKSLEIIAKVYELIIKAGVHRVKSIKVAEATKVVENSQRDVNIAFMNELSIVFNKIGIDTNEVIEAMNTKWNALNFYPGLVGGHCIGVDPYYFIYQAEKLGYHSQIILSGRIINNNMIDFVTGSIIKNLILSNKVVNQSKLALVGVTFKENCKDIRNSKVFEIAKKLQEYNVELFFVDPLADLNEVRNEYLVNLTSFDKMPKVDCLVFCVAHDEFKKYSMNFLNNLFINKKGEQKVLIDIKSIYYKNIKPKEFRYWTL